MLTTEKTSHDLKKLLSPRTRFAPSPTGYLHLGHLVNAIYVWGVVAPCGGEVVLRLEDHDRGRCRPHFEAAILDDLAWLDLIPDIGPISEFRNGTSPRRQSDNDILYQEQIERLAAQDMLYTCTCSRKEILARIGAQGGELRYDGHCRTRGYRPDLEGGTRVHMADESISFHDLRRGDQEQQPVKQCGDVLLKDRHGNWTYQFAVTVDDWLQGVDLVIRGDDLLASTGRQIQLARLLGRVAPPRFLHHPLIHDHDGNKLSKRDFSKGLHDYRSDGVLPEEVLGEAAMRVGLIQTPRLSKAELFRLFDQDNTHQNHEQAAAQRPKG